METLDHPDRDRIQELLGRDEFFWLDLESPGDAELDEVGDQLGWHPLALEDAREFEQRPKLDDYPNHALLVFYGVEDGELAEVHLFVSGEWIVTVHRRPCAPLAALHARGADQAAGSEEELVYRILDALTDSFFPALEAADDQLEELENEIVAQPSDQQLGQVLTLRRRLGPMRRIAEDQCELFSNVRALLERMPGLERDRAAEAFRDVSDHLERIADLVEGLRDRVRDSLGLYASTNSNRLNEVITRLTVVSTVFLPLTFVVGFFGQNFGWMVDHVDSFTTFLLYGVGGVTVPLVLTVLAFRRLGLLSER